jgi:hypothetical protein
MVPTHLIDAIQDIRRKAKLLSIGYGVGVVLAAVVALLCGLVVLDWALNLPAWPRVALIIGALVLVGWTARRFIWRPASTRITLSDIAGRLEQTFPQFDDRLRSTIDFVREGYVPGSDMMKRRTIEQASRLAEQVNLRAAVVATPALRSIGGGLGALLALLLVATVVLDGRTLQIITSRLLTPFDGLPWPKRVEIKLLEELPTRVPVGQRIEVKMKLARGDKPSIKPIVYYQLDGGPVQREFMTRGEDGAFSASLDARLDAAAEQGRLKVWMTAGDDRVEATPVTVVPRLSIASAEATVQPPDYARGAGSRGQQTFNILTVPASAVEGSKVTFRYVFNKPLTDEPDAVRLEPLGDNAAELVKSNRTIVGRGATFEWDVRLPPGEQQTLRFKIRAKDLDGFQNDALEEFALRVDRDQKPSVQIELPRRNEERTAVSRVPLQAVVEDDFGFQFVRLSVKRLNRLEQSWDIPLFADGKPADGVAWTRVEGSGERQRYRVNYVWLLSKLKDLQPGDVLEYHLLVQDNFELDGKRHDPAASDKLRITIISQSELIDRVSDELRQVREQVAQVQRGQERTRNETATLREETKDKSEFDPADRAAAERVTQQQSSTASATRQLAQRVEAARQRLEENESPAEDLKNLAGDVRDRLNRAAENPMKRATQELSRAAAPEQPREPRNQALDNAQEQQRQASEELKGAMESMSSIGSLASAIEEFNQIANEQRQTSEQTQEAGKSSVGKKPEQLTPEERKKIEDAARRQEQLADRTEQAVQKLEDMAKQMEQSDPAAAEAMRNAAKTARQQNVPQNQRKASQQSRQNQQQAAQSSQRQVELGLEMVLNELREAERRRLQELQRQLADLQKQVQALVRRQAGHNLDNLSIQGAERLARLTADERRQLDTLAEREARRDGQPAPVPDLGQLTSGQQLTERNARDISRAAERVRNGGDIAARLSRAAGRMERAIFPLRERKLEEAYAPPQVEALAELLQAQQLVDEMKKDVEQQMEQQQREAIRQRFIKIRDDQVKQVNVETAALDKQRGNGELGRAERIRANQVAEAERKLAARVRELDADLASLNSIVYVWANKDIARSMDQVVAELSEARTGEPTQSEQARIVEQLNAMIANLAAREPEEEFEKPNDGGGSGSGAGGEQKPRLPAEAELRLLKALQEAVNASTKRIDAVARDRRDAEQLEALGNRQGELRNLLDELLQSASQGRLKLGPEPDNLDQLPEEADPDAVSDQELMDDLLGGNPNADQLQQEVVRIGTRMSRSRQRLADNKDPGKVTQLIQEKILGDFDLLIKEAQQQQQQSKQQSQSQSQGQQQQRPQQQQGQAPNQGQNQPGQSQPNQGQSPAQNSQAPGGGSNQADLSKPLQETSAEWGTISPRLRDAVLESKNEDIVGEYRRMIEQYYKAVATEATKR